MNQLEPNYRNSVRRIIKNLFVKTKKRKKTYRTFVKILLRKMKHPNSTIICICANLCISTQYVVINSFGFTVSTIFISHIQRQKGSTFDTVQSSASLRLSQIPCKQFSELVKNVHRYSQSQYAWILKRLQYIRAVMNEHIMRK